MRLIDADDRIEFIKNVYCPECDNYNGVRCRACPINDMIDAIDDAPTVDQWHYPSKGDLPETDDHVLCCTQTKSGLKNIVIGYYMDGLWRCGMNSNVIAWQPLPTPPEEA